jgi:hypothetical protein
MELAADVFAEGLEELVEERRVRFARVDGVRDLGRLTSLSRRAEELDVGEGLVEKRELLGAGPPTCTDGLPPGVRERHGARLSPLCIHRAPDAEEPCDHLRKDDQRSTNSPTERVHDPSPSFCRDDVPDGPGSTWPRTFFARGTMRG